MNRYKIIITHHIKINLMKSIQQVLSELWCHLLDKYIHYISFYKQLIFVTETILHLTADDKQLQKKSS